MSLLFTGNVINLGRFLLKTRNLFFLPLTQNKMDLTRRLKCAAFFVFIKKRQLIRNCRFTFI